MADASSAWSASYTAARSVDGNLGTYWSTATGAVDGAFINYHFASPVRVTGLRMYPPAVTGYYAVARVATLTFFDAGGVEIESQEVQFDGPYDDWQDVSIAAVSGVSRIELFPTELTAEGRPFVTIHEIEFFGSVLSSTCVQECGVGNPVPAWASDVQMLECDVMGIPLVLSFNLQGAPQGVVQAGAANTFDLSLQTIIPESFVNLLLNLTTSATLESATGTIVATAGTTDVNTVPLALNGTPCDVCFEANNAVVTEFPQTGGSWTLDLGNQQELTLADVSLGLDAAGLALLLTTTGPDPTCGWTTTPPTLAFTAP
jgi:hypothetical protein